MTSVDSVNFLDILLEIALLIGEDIFFVRVLTDLYFKITFTGKFAILVAIIAQVKIILEMNVHHVERFIFRSFIIHVSDS